MRPNLINGQHLIDSFLQLLPQGSESKGIHYSSCLKGVISIEELSESVKNKLPDIFNWQPPQNDWGKQLFSGKTSMHNGDHSSADIALIGYFFKNGLTAQEADQVFRASGLYRTKWDELRGEQAYGERTIAKVYNFRQFEDSREYAFNNTPDLNQFEFGSSKNYKPIYVPNGMLPRRFLGPQIADFADTAAIVENLDLVICVDTAVAHIAGAIGKACWVLLPDYKTDWRWLTGRSDSPWYPGVLRLFRQPRMGDWATVVAEVRTALQTLVAKLNP